MRAPSRTGRQAPTRAVIGLGSNMPHGRHGRPEAVLRAAAEALGAGGFRVAAMAPIRQSRPLGPSARCYANSALIGFWLDSPEALLTLCKQVERDFGRLPGRRWGARVIDCDIWLIGQLVLETRTLQIPHQALAHRRFVLQPLVALWPEWHHPQTGLTPRHMLARLQKPVAVDFAPPPA